MDHAREWASDNAEALVELRRCPAARATLAHACNRWGAPMVWPWGDRPALTGADKRVVVAIRSGAVWRANEDTIARLLAFGEVRYTAEGRLSA
jgi:hypothetical protein